MEINNRNEVDTLTKGSVAGIISLCGKKCVVVGLFLLFAILFFSTSWFIIKRDAVHAEEEFVTHAAIIADDMWAVNEKGAVSYLRLAMVTHHYSSLTLSQLDGENIILERSERFNPVDQFFYRLGLIPKRYLCTPISYKNENIGTLQGEQYVRIVYPLINVFLVLLWVGGLVLFFLYLFWSRQALEQQVHLRTKSLRESEERFHDLVNLLPEMVWEVDRSGVILFANQLAINRFNLDGSEMEGASWFRLVLDSEQTRAGQCFEASMQGEDSGLLEFNGVDKDGTVFPLLIRVGQIVRDGNVTGARCVGVDISERKYLESELHHAQKMKAIGLMAGGVAHDLNNILSGIVNYPELILRNLPEDDTMRFKVESIKKAGIQAAEVVSDLLTVARGAAAHREVCDPNLLIYDYLESLEFEKLHMHHPQVEIRQDLVNQIGNIYCSPTHVRKSLMNLVTNGVESVAAAGGVVVISTTQQHVSDKQAGLLDPGRYVCITVQDSGAGIAKEDQEHIFEPFYSKKKLGQSGTGLGLAVVWNTMQDHDGIVEISSVPGDTRFTMFFPVSDEKLPDKIHSPEMVTYMGNGEKILVVDDEEQQRTIASELLQMLNYQVDTVESGEQCLEYLKENRVDLILLDMLMEPGIDGAETFLQAVKIQPAIKTVIASGFAESAAVQEVLKNGEGVFITKPYTMEILGVSIKKLLSDA